MGIAASIAGALLYAIARGPWEILAGAVATGLGLGGGAVSATLLAESVPNARRPSVFGVNFLVVNIVMGVGGIVAALAALSQDVLAFRLLHVGDIVTFVVAALLFRRAMRCPRPPVEAVRLRGAQGPRPATSLLVACLAMIALAYLVGYAQLESGVPALLLGAGAGSALLAVVFVANAAGVVVGQAVLLKRVAIASTGRLVIWIGVLWAGSWLVLGMSLLLPGNWIVIVAACGAVLFALGECIYAVTVPVLLNSLTDDRARGRVNGWSSAATSTGFVLGPLLAGALLTGEAVPAYLAVMIAGSIVIGAGLRTVMLRLPGARPRKDAEAVS